MTINFQDDMDDIFLESGFQEDISYNGATISAIITYGDNQKMSGGRVNPYTKNLVTILVSKTDVSIVSPQEDVVLITRNGASKTYRVGGVRKEDSASFTLGLI